MEDKSTIVTTLETGSTLVTYTQKKKKMHRLWTEEHATLSFDGRNINALYTMDIRNKRNINMR